MPTPDLIICDIDGCLTPEAPGPFDVAGLAEVAEYNRLATQRRDRPRLTLCSGRPVSYVEAMCRLVHNVSVPAVAENGVWLYDPLSNIPELDPQITPQLLELVQHATRHLAAQFAADGCSLQAGKAASVTLYHPDHDQLTKLLPRVAQEVADRQWPFRVSMSWYYLNCDLLTVSKASGVQRLLAKTGVAPGRTLGIGDTLGDLAIARQVSVFACPANAEAELQRVAAYVSPYPEVAGVLDILRQFTA